MGYRFVAHVSRGEDKGKKLVPWKDKDGNFVLFDPRRRDRGSVHSKDYTLTRSSKVAKDLIADRGFRMRMVLEGSKKAARLIAAKSITIARDG